MIAARLVLLFLLLAAIAIPQVVLNLDPRGSMVALLVHFDRVAGWEDCRRRVAGMISRGLDRIITGRELSG